jgi:hypothetical protein
MHRKLARNHQSNAVSLKDKKNYGIGKIIVLNICDPAGLQCGAQGQRGFPA